MFALYNRYTRGGRAYEGLLALYVLKPEKTLPEQRNTNSNRQTNEERRSWILCLKRSASHTAVVLLALTLCTVEWSICSNRLVIGVLCMTDDSAWTCTGVARTLHGGTVACRDGKYCAASFEVTATVTVFHNVMRRDLLHKTRTSPSKCPIS